MSNKIVTDVANLLMTNGTNLLTGINPGIQQTSDAGDFTKVMNDATSKVKEISEAFSTGASGNTVVDKSGTKEIETGETVKKDPVQNPEDRKEVAKDVAEKADEIKDEIKKAFNIDDDELETAMANLGISLQDLINPDKLKNLMMELGGITDSISLLTNADLYESFKMISQMAIQANQEINSQYGITAEELNVVLEDDELFAEVIAEMESSDNGMVTNEIALPESMGQQGETVVSETGEANGNIASLQNSEQTEAVEDAAGETDNKGISVTVNREDNASNNRTENVTESAENQSNTTGETESFQNIEKPQTDPNKGRNEGFENGSRFGNEEKTTVSDTTIAGAGVETITTDTSVNSVGDIVETVTHYSNADGHEIVSQITESVKVNISQDVTSMEMQLHPASLGTVNMQISSANGIVTAHILVQNEAVKAAIENQLITLQETFEASGQKVEAVEVSVANYNLDRGMNGNENRDGRGEEQKGGIRVGGRRRINLNLNELDDVDALDLDEEEKIRADMMSRNGNSVDYLA